MTFCVWHIIIYNLRWQIKKNPTIMSFFAILKIVLFSISKMPSHTLNIII